MTTAEISDRLNAVPFIPFRVVTADGAEFQVPHPDFAATKKHGRYLLVLHEDDESFDIVDVALITRLSVDPVPVK